MWILLLLLERVVSKKGFSPLSTFHSPKTPNQKLYVNELTSDRDIIFCMGSAGTGKTLFACNESIRKLKNKEIEKIILTRPIVAVEDEQLGFLPGSITKKMDPWTRPIMDIFAEHYQLPEINKMLVNGVIEISPLAYMRGRTFKNSYIIADEMQNSTPNQMLMLTTRIGTNSKLVVTGDIQQSDRSRANGLTDFVEKFDGYLGNKDRISVINMTEDDVQRSEVVKMILDIYKDPVERKGYYDTVIDSFLKETREKSRKKSTPSLPSNNDAALMPLHDMTGIYPSQNF